jgi:hypothetical protein
MVAKRKRTCRMGFMHGNVKFRWGWQGSVREGREWEGEQHGGRRMGGR